MRNVLCTLALALVPAASFAQVAATNLIGVDSQNCPVGFSADRVLQSRMEAVGHVQGELRPGDDLRRIYLHVSPLIAVNPEQALPAKISDKAVVKARVVLYGDDGGGRVQPAGLSSSASAIDRSENVELLPTAANPSTNYRVTLNHLRNISSISILELDFADGHVWHSSGDSYCHAKPNGFHLIDAKSR